MKGYEEILRDFDCVLDDETEARYLCLIEGLEFIDNKLLELGLEGEELETARASNRVYKALCAYIEERFHAMLADLRAERAKEKQSR